MKNMRIPLNRIYIECPKGSGCKTRLFICYLGRANTPWNQIADMKVQDKGIKISTGVPGLQHLGQCGLSGHGRLYGILP